MTTTLTLYTSVFYLVVIGINILCFGLGYELGKNKILENESKSRKGKQK